MNDSVEIYRRLCSYEISIPLFSRDWWLDATAGESNWSVALVMDGDSVLAALPYTYRKKYGFTILGQPPLSQTAGPWINLARIKNNSKYLSIQKDLYFELINQLPVYARYQQNWHWTCTNWLPFYWKGFDQTTRYTYILKNIKCLDDIWKGFQSNIRTDIKKAASRYGLRVRDDLSVDDFIPLNRKTFERQGLSQPYSDSFLRRVDSACIENKARRIFIAEDENGLRHAGVYIVWDANSAYYLMGGGDPELRNSGATSLCMWEAIKFSSTKVDNFDFEGSMIEPVERFFRAFGAVQTPYFSVEKTTSWLLKILLSIRD